MPSENKTPNLGLNQWQGNEYPKRQDFVEDNFNIDQSFQNLKNMVGSLEGLTTVEKANVVAAINEINNNVKTHEAENVYYTVAVARDISLTGIQSISLPFKTKSIICFAYIDATRVQSNGMWAENALQRAIAVQGDSGNRIGAVAVAFLRLTNANHAQCVVQNVTETGFELNWTKTGSPTGNASLFILASTHGGVA